MLYDINGNNIEEIFKEELKHYSKIPYTKDIYICFMKHILEYKYLRDLIDETPREIISNVFSPTQNKTYFYPCDISELRIILSEKNIYRNNIALFSSNIAKKYLNRYPILLSVTGMEDPKYNLNGILLYKNKLSLSNNNGIIKHIVIQEPMSEEKRLIISNILLDFSVDVFFQNAIPGASSYNPKLAQDITQTYVKRQVGGLPVNKPGGNPLGLNKGDRVRWRNRGMLLNQYYGRVISITEKHIVIAWDMPNKKNIITKFPSQDPLLIWKYIAKE